MHDIHAEMNLIRRYIAALSDLVALAAEREDAFLLGHYSELRRDAAEGLNGTVAEAFRAGELSQDEAAAALSPIVSVETAHAFR